MLAFETNTAVVTNPPKDWTDLLKPEYKGQVALAGDPRVANQAIQAVYAAALSPTAARSTTPSRASTSSRSSTTPATSCRHRQAGHDRPGRDADHDPLDLQRARHRDAAAGNPEIDVAVPTTGRFGGVYVQAISAYAPHPNAAKLWMEYLYSDEGQNIWLKGYCNPARFDAMKAANAIPADLLAKLPDTSGAVFPTLDQLNKATDADHQELGLGRRRGQSSSRPRPDTETGQTS